MVFGGTSKVCYHCRDEPLSINASFEVSSHITEFIDGNGLIQGFYRFEGERMMQCDLG